MLWSQSIFLRYDSSMFKSKNVLYYPRYLFGLFLICMFTFSAFRLAHVIFADDLFFALPNFMRPILTTSFVNGLIFDFQTSVSILFIPTIILSLSTLLSFSEKFSYTLASFFFLLFFGVSIILHMADFTFFTYFFERMNSTVFVWFAMPDIVIKMLLREPSYFSALMIGALIISVGIYINFRFTRLFVLKKDTYPTLTKQFFALLLAGAIFTLAFHIKQFNTLAATPYPVAKKLALNPAQTMFESLLRDLTKTRNISKLPADHYSYEVLPKTSLLETPIHLSPKKHVVIVIMESMMAKNMAVHGGDARTTPRLNQLREKSISFDHAYTAGIHTFNGIYSTIFSHPGLLRDQPMLNMENANRANIGRSLSENGYTSNYFTTHVDYFDNVGDLLRAGGFQNIFHEKNYPPELAPTPMGVPDHVQFDFVIQRMNEQHARGDKILSVIMTGSNHNPYVLPKNISFKSPFENIKITMTAYADWAIGKFLDDAQKEAWFQDTLFVFVADHGLVKNPVYDMPLSYYHTPLLFYAHDITAQKFEQLASQMDIYPTVMGTLNLPWENTTQGVNLLTQKRNYVFLNNDEKLAILTEDDFYIQHELGEMALYSNWKNNQLINLKSQLPQKTTTYQQLVNQLTHQILK
jgi:phosphoglycerol transferase MdoB-like AlkP superfamily enzyme